MTQRTLRALAGLTLGAGCLVLVLPLIFVLAAWLPWWGRLGLGLVGLGLMLGAVAEDWSK